ncbi:hypothetical protein KEM55_006825, partial [Ascosphaera atra]
TRKFLLEINPNFVHRTKKDIQNVIDARWIDMSSGLFIDITSVRKDYEARAKGQKGALMCKDYHRYKEEDLFPLRDSYFEGLPVKIPYAYNKLLIEEYGEKALTETHFEHHDFDYDLKEWIPESVEEKKQEEEEERKKKAEQQQKEKELEAQKQAAEEEKKKEEEQKQKEQQQQQQQQQKKQDEQPKQEQPQQQQQQTQAQQS